MAERVPFFTLFESFQAPRQLRLLLHDACIISGALDMAGRTLEVQVESSETLPQAAQDALQQMLAQQYDLRQVLLHFCGTGEQKGDNGDLGQDDHRKADAYRRTEYQAGQRYCGGPGIQGRVL